MEHHTRFIVGIDLHQDTDAPNDLVKFKRFFGRLTRRGEVRACYEAGGCGSVLQR